MWGRDRDKSVGRGAGERVGVEAEHPHDADELVYRERVALGGEDRGDALGASGAVAQTRRAHSIGPAIGMTKSGRAEVVRVWPSR